MRGWVAGLMQKRRIDAKEALEDIRRGMDDGWIMRKYGLSRTGLESLYRKLADVGVVRQLNPQDVVRDIQEGATDEDLMQRYRLSSRGLENLFEQLAHAGFITWDVIEGRRIGRVGARAREAVAPPASQESPTPVQARPSFTPIRADEDWNETAEPPVGNDVDADREDGDIDDTIDLRETTNLVNEPAHASSIVESIDVSAIRKLLGLAQMQAPQSEEPSPPEEELVWECPVCLAQKSREYDVCPECGAFVTDEEEIEEDAAGPPPPATPERTSDPARAGLDGSDDGRGLPDTPRYEDVADDMRAGMTDAELIRKYRLTSETLPLLFERMVRAGVITKAEADWRPQSYEESF